MPVTKTKALADFINVNRKSIKVSPDDNAVFKAMDTEFSVMTDDEADTAAKGAVLMSLVTIPFKDLHPYCRLGVTQECVDALQDIGSEAIMSLYYLLNSPTDFVKEQLDKHGRAYYLASDNEENDENGFLIYRLN